MKKFSFVASGDRFLLNSKPYTILSGAMHYWRIPRKYWADRLKKLLECGFNTLETYVPWNLHERKEGEFDFSGNLDIVAYIKAAAKIGLNVIVRPGPYICAEFDLGGLPSWLLKYKQIRLRCNDPLYLRKAEPYYRELLTRVAPLQCTHGGPIIMMQVENEYGSYGDDKIYLKKVESFYHKYGIDVQLYTSDGPCMWMLSGGTIPSLPATVNFGSNPDGAFKTLREFRPGAPLMCGEFWCGWFDHWGEKHHTRTAQNTAEALEPMLKSGASLNFYMFHGGTNFAFTSGANHTGAQYQPTITSYDYGAPLSESGDLTPTYHVVRKMLHKYSGRPLKPLTVADSTKKAYGKIALTQQCPVLESLGAFPKPVKSPSPLCMEDIGQDFGFILYSTTLKGPFEKLNLVLEHIHDRAVVFADGKVVGFRERTGRKDPIDFELPAGKSLRLDILVENCGRVNYGSKLLDRKGIFDGIRLGQRYHFGWEMTAMRMENDELKKIPFRSSIAASDVPVFLKGSFNIEGEPSDTFVALESFHKGFVVVNGYNLGRYWMDKGPQRTLYLPAPFLKKGKNEIIVFETDGIGANPSIELVDHPNLG